MTTASKITLARVALIPVYMVLMYLSGGEAGPMMFSALAVFIFASLTDFVDGYIARHYNQVSDFGKFLDPLADKLLTLAAMTTPLPTATNRRPVTANSRVSTIISAHAGKVPHSQNIHMAAMVSSLSARGSRNLPKSVVWL